MVPEFSNVRSAMAAFGRRSPVIFAVTMGVFLSTLSVMRFVRFLSGFDVLSPNVVDSSFDAVYIKTVVNWTLASSYLYLPSLVGSIVQKIGDLIGLPRCYFKFIKIVSLTSILNVVISFWQNIPEICLWRLNGHYLENILIYSHCFMWIISFMIMLAIDITELIGLKSIWYYYLTNGSRASFKSKQFDRFLSNMGFPGSSCLIVILWAQIVMSFDRLMLALIWTMGLCAFNKNDNKDIQYVSRQIEKKKAWMYFSQEITVSPLK